MESNVQHSNLLIAMLSGEMESKDIYSMCVWTLRTSEWMEGKIAADLMDDFQQQQIAHSQAEVRSVLVNLIHHLDKHQSDGQTGISNGMPKS